MKRSVLHRILLLIFIAVPLLNGCVVTEQLKRNYQESTEAYYAPENIDSNTQSTGLLLVDAVTKKALNTMSLSGVEIANVKKPEKKIIFGSFKTGGILSQISGVVVIPNLQPGTYKIVKINTWNVNMWETLYMPSSKEFEIEVKAGSPVYFGQIQVHHPMFSTDREITINYNKARERASWEMVMDKYNESAWIKIISNHVRTLQ